MGWEGLGFTTIDDVKEIDIIVPRTYLNERNCTAKL